MSCRPPGRLGAAGRARGVWRMRGANRTDGSAGSSGVSGQGRQGSAGLLEPPAGAAPAPAAVQTTNRIVGARRWWALAAVMLSMFFSALDQTVVAAAMPVIISELRGFSLYAWVFTAYMMASAVTVPIYGKLSDVYGRKPFYLFGLTTFMVGSMLCGQARSMEALVAARALQGVGGGALLSMPSATIGDIFNPRERARWMALVMLFFGVASTVGPGLGGWITDQWGWRWVFYINLPVGLAALATVAYALPTVRVPARVSIDWPGSLLLVLTLVPLLLAFTWAGSHYLWGSPRVLGLLGLAVVAGVAFWAAERRARDPLLPPELFRHPVFRATSTLMLLISMSMFSAIMFVPLFVEGVLGVSAQHSGVVLTPMMLSFIVGSILSGQILSRTGRYKWQALVATGIMTTGLVLLSRMGPDTPVGQVLRNVVVLGIGVGAMMPLVNVAAQNAFPYRMLGVVNATQQFMRSLGGVMAAPILGSVLAATFRRSLAAHIPPAVARELRGQLAGLDPQSLITGEAQLGARAAVERLGSGRLHQILVEAVRQGLAAGTARTFAVAISFGLAAIVACFLLREIPLRQDDFFADASLSALGEVAAPVSSNGSTITTPSSHPPRGG